MCKYKQFISYNRAYNLSFHLADVIYDREVVDLFVHVLVPGIAVTVSRTSVYIVVCLSLRL